MWESIHDKVVKFYKALLDIQNLLWKSPSDSQGVVFLIFESISHHFQNKQINFKRKWTKDSQGSITEELEHKIWYNIKSTPINFPLIGCFYTINT